MWPQMNQKYYCRFLTIFGKEQTYLGGSLENTEKVKLGTRTL